MKKITYLIFLLFFLDSCTGYKPIFGSTSLQFKIADYSIEGNKILGNKIYSKLLRLSESKKNDQNARNINLLINVSKNKKVGAKDSAGKILNYKITLNTAVEITDFITNNKILGQTFTSSLSYKVQEQHSETIKLESKSIDDLINKIYSDLLIKLSQNISTK